MSKISEDKDGGWLIHKAGRGWYRPNAEGYTNDTKQAGRYSHADARSYSHPNGWDGPRDGITIKHESELRSGGEEKNGVGDLRDKVEALERSLASEGEGVNAYLRDDIEQAISAMRSALTNTDLSLRSLRAENERLKKERDAILTDFHTTALALGAAEAKLEEAAKVMEPFANVRDQHPESVKLINGKIDGFTLMSVSVTKDQFIAAHSFLANLKGAE